VFGQEHLSSAEELLEGRHTRHCRTRDLLRRDGVREALEHLWLEQGGSSGMVAVQGGEVVGYLLGCRTESPIFGRSVWIHRAGHAADDPEVMRDLYAAAAPEWLNHGFDRHYVYVPAIPEYLDPWYRLGFAQMHLEAIRDTGREHLPFPQGVTVRRGSPADIEEIAIPFNNLIAETQARAPSFSTFRHDSIEDQRADWSETFDDPSAAYFVVERGGTPIGHSLLYAPDRNLGDPLDALYLASTVIVPSEQGCGIGTALATYVLSWAREQGHGTLLTNWRVTNLMASRFWTAAGWRPTFLRLQRVPAVN
jgi:GNAT superfamily N-acetyltransferase